MPRRSTRLSEKPKVTYFETQPRRKRCRLVLTVTHSNYELGGDMPNVYGERCLRPGTQSRMYDLSITRDFYVRDEGIEMQRPPGIGYAAITQEHFDEITACHLLLPQQLATMVREQFKTMHAYTWRRTVAFSNPRYMVYEVNKEGVLRNGRVPREYPMLRASPLRIPTLKHVAAISYQNSKTGETCVPVAIFTWLTARKRDTMHKDACERYPTALPMVKDAKGHVCKPKVTIENVTKLLDAIHADSNHPTDPGHTVADVEVFCSLFHCKMYARNIKGAIISEVVDGDKNHPLCFTTAHGHMYWHCDRDAVKFITKSAVHQRHHGCRRFVGASDDVPKKQPTPSVFRIVTLPDMHELLETGVFSERTTFLVQRMKDVEGLFFEFGWKHGQPTSWKETEKRIRQFTFVTAEEVEVTVGADPFYEMVQRADREGEEFDHAILFDACKDHGIAVDPLHGLGNVARTILRPTRKAITVEVRNTLFENQNHHCRSCGFLLDDCRTGSHVDHIKPLANGANDEISNMQLLCTPCHETKTAQENAIGYSSDLTHSSRFNPRVLNDVILTPQYQCLEFVEGWWPFVGLRVVDRETNTFLGTISQRRDLEGMWSIASAHGGTQILRPMYSFAPESLSQLLEHPDAPEAFKHAVERDSDKGVVLRSLDIKGCRRNGIMNPKAEWPVFTVLDDYRAFSGTLQEGGEYFVNTLLGFRGGGWHGSKWYRYAMVAHGIATGQIYLWQIKYERIPTSTLPKDYFRSRVERLEKPFQGNQMLKKLFPLLDIGCMGRQKQTLSQRDFSLSQQEAAGKVIYDTTGFECGVYKAHTLADRRDIWCTLYEYECAHDAYALPIYEQIKEEEAMNVFEIYQLVLEGGGFPLEVKTDAIVYACVPNGRHPIAAPDVYDGMPYPGVFWDKEQTIPKYKFETPTFLRSERFHQTVQMAAYELPLHDARVRFNDVMTDDLDFMTEQPRDHTNWSRHWVRHDRGGLFLSGDAGTGKSHISRSMIAEAKTMHGDEGVLVLASTNKAARIIGGGTVHKFFKRFDKKIVGKGRFALQREIRTLKYVFVDEISMLHTWFWGKLCSLRETFPHLVFIMAGDFGQLDPVADVCEGICYEDNVALHYLVDGNRFRLTQCRRADKAFFDVCQDVRAGHEIDVARFPVTQETGPELCYYNATRKARNVRREILFNRGKAVSSRIPACHSLPQSQDVTLSVGYPLIARSNDGDENKNEGWVVTQLTDDGFTAQRVAMEHESDEDEQPTLTAKFTAFHHLFQPGFCQTVHAAQGDTFRVLGTIYDWDAMTTKLRYTAITRWSSAELVQIDVKNKQAFQDGSTFEEKASDERYVAWARTKTPEAGSTLDRFLQFVNDRTTALHDARDECAEEDCNDERDSEDDDGRVTTLPVVEGEVTWADMTSGSAQPESLAIDTFTDEDEHIVRLRAAQKRRREQDASAPTLHKRPKSGLMSLAEMRRLRDM